MFMIHGVHQPAKDGIEVLQHWQQWMIWKAAILGRSHARCAPTRGGECGTRKCEASIRGPVLATGEFTAVAKFMAFGFLPISEWVMVCEVSPRAVPCEWASG